MEEIESTMKVSKLDQLFKESVKKLEKRTKSREDKTFLTTGFTKLDDMIGGWEEGEVVVIGSRPVAGKTALMLSMMKNIARNSDHAVGFISLESPISHIMERIISSEAKIPMVSLKKANLNEKDWNRIIDAMSELKEDRIFMVDHPEFTIEGIQEVTQQMVNENSVKVVLIDYLQLIEGMRNRKNREQEVSSVIRELKKLAKELDIVIIIASQLNRTVELRAGNKRPMLSDLRDSGAIEEDTDKVIFIHRPELYDIWEDEYGNSLVGITDLVIAKNRTGPIGDVKINFDNDFGFFYEILTDPKAFGDISLDDLPDHDSPF